MRLRPRAAPRPAAASTNRTRTMTTPTATPSTRSAHCTGPQPRAPWPANSPATTAERTPPSPHAMPGHDAQMQQRPHKSPPSTRGRRSCTATHRPSPSSGQDHPRGPLARTDGGCPDVMPWGNSAAPISHRHPRGGVVTMPPRTAPRPAAARTTRTRPCPARPQRRQPHTNATSFPAPVAGGAPSPII